MHCYGKEKEVLDLRVYYRKKMTVSSFFWLVESYTFWWADELLPKWTSDDKKKFMDSIAKFLREKKKGLGISV